MNTYHQNVKDVSAKTMLITIGHIEEHIFDADICWMVSDNIREMLAYDPYSKVTAFEKINDIDNMITFIADQFHNNKVLIIWQDQFIGTEE